MEKDYVHIENYGLHEYHFQLGKDTECIEVNFHINRYNKNSLAIYRPFYDTNGDLLYINRVSWLHTNEPYTIKDKYELVVSKTPDDINVKFRMSAIKHTNDEEVNYKLSKIIIYYAIKALGVIEGMDRKSNSN